VLGVQCSLLDFYKLHYSYWGLASDRTGPAPEEIARVEGRAGMDRLVLRLAASYAGAAAALRALSHRAPRRVAAHRDRPGFRERYASRNRRLLELWYLVGPSWHAYLFFLFGLLGRMDLFFAVQLLGQNGLLIFL